MSYLGVWNLYLIIGLWLSEKQVPTEFQQFFNEIYTNFIHNLLKFPNFFFFFQNLQFWKYSAYINKYYSKLIPFLIFALFSRHLNFY